jgi:hypothetical protein
MDVNIQMELDRARDPLIDKEEKSLCIKTASRNWERGPLLFKKEALQLAARANCRRRRRPGKCPWCNNKAIQTPHHTDAAACASHRLMLGGGQQPVSEGRCR